ncbi:peptidase S28 [Xylariaceae sp. FL0255]|nr:peptidase S28 [Xylariaceae sp. FL0255]
MKTSTRAAAALLGAVGVSANFQRARTAGMKIGPIDETTTPQFANGTAGWGTFDQLLDHSNPSLGTFKQRWWYGAQFWNGSGSPIILTNPGEQAADGFNVTYTTEQRLTGLMAKEVGGAVVVLEHRYWGESSPYQSLTPENLKYLTLENSILDNTYFAKNWEAPFDKKGKSTAKDAPWVFTGGSYPGALAGWIAATDPGTYWAYYGTSGVVETISDFWQYFVPVEEATPANCTKDLNAVIDYVDSVLLHGSAKEKHALKARFNLTSLEDADFGSALENGPWSWQEGQFYSEPLDGFNPYYQFCDYVENQWPNTTEKVPGANGVGLTKALAGYAKWWNEVEFPGLCESYGYFEGEYNAECLQGLNASNPIYHDLTPANTGDRQWNWLLCTAPFEYWQDGAPKGNTTFVSRLVNVEYWRSQCPLWFPGVDFGFNKGKSAAVVDKFTGGWDITNTTRLMLTNGEWDPWRDSTVSSSFRPGGPLKSTEELPVRVLKHGTHCSDLYGENWAVNADAKAIADSEVAQMAGWIAEWYTQKGKYPTN